MIFWNMVLLCMFSMCDTFMCTQECRVDDVISKYTNLVIN